ncbi:hypothetical protein P691DRAFT_806504 [Macrolepiota fuliginosa MF-IS2]|uniref:Uncharacterized protein n=1 Tax=Macrolepiota fuliginosa MF-IS2 TaxID=1400762 RepID=A0A9P5XMH2_9AGAR|nr:hypothetical protein P691DRAFT_806504 [Macrolepiota fuliginosa MF-IS2]
MGRQSSLGSGHYTEPAFPTPRARCYTRYNITGSLSIVAALLWHPSHCHDLQCLKLFKLWFPYPPSSHFHLLTQWMLSTFLGAASTVG